MNNKVNLTGVRMLMGISLVVLSAFVVYWLNSQYNDEKQTLKKELMADLVRAQRDITDSVVFEKYIAPIVWGADTGTIATPFKPGDSAITSRNSKITFYSTPKDTMLLESLKTKFRGDALQHRILKNKVHITYGDSAIEQERTLLITGSDARSSIGDTMERALQFPGTTVYGEGSDSAVARIIAGGVRSLLKQAFSENSNALSLRFTFNDSGLIRSEFEEGLAIRNRAMRAIWMADSSARPGRPNGSIYLEYDNFGTKAIVAISGYNLYLVQKIIPPVLFALLLISLILLSFIITYRGMKHQMKLSEMKNGLISNMSHELKTPVATVKVALEALEDYDVMKHPDQALEYIQMARLETQRLEMLISKALNTSLMEQGKIVIEREIYDIAVLARETVGLLKIRLQQNGAVVNLHTEGDDFETNIDQLHVQGALLNIIDNSLKYGTPPVHIDIHITARDAGITIDVRDNGPGIAEEYAEQVFEKFFRVPKGDQHNVQGYGLGLSYVQQVMQLHNGVARLHNDMPAGTHFSLQFFKGR